MVPPAELLADLRQGELGHLPDDVHSHVAGSADLLILALPSEGGGVQLIEPGHLLDDGVRRGQEVLLGPQDVPHGADGGLHIHLGAHQLLEGHDLVDHALDLAHAGGDVVRDIGQYRIGKGDPPLHRFVFQQGHPEFIVRLLDVGGQALLEPGAQALLQAEHLMGRPVGGKHDLLFLLVQGVEGVEQLFLAGVLAGDELHIVHQKQIHAAVLVPELLHINAPAEVADELVYKVLALDVEDTEAGMILSHPVGDGVEQMSLAQAGLPVDEQGVIGPARLVRHLLGGGEGEFVGGAHHEPLKGVFFRLPAAGVGGGALGGVGVPLLREQQGHIHVEGEQLLQRRLHPRLEAGADDVPLEIGGDAQHQPGVLQGHGLHIPKPGVDGHGGHAALHQALYFFPDVGGRSHGRKPPNCEMS